MKLSKIVPWIYSGSCLVKIRVRDAVAGSRDHEIGQLPVVIGRGSAADIQLSDHWVSKVHCCLRVADGRLVVRDLESRNGTAVNYRNAAEQPLRAGDEVSIGMSEFEVLEVADQQMLSAGSSRTECQHD